MGICENFKFGRVTAYKIWTVFSTYLCDSVESISLADVSQVVSPISHLLTLASALLINDVFLNLNF